MIRKWMLTVAIVSSISASMTTARSEDAPTPKPPRPSGAGDTFIDVGWFHIQNFDSSQAVQSSILVPLPAFVAASSTFGSPGTSENVNNSDTPALTAIHFFTDHIAVEAVGGVPAKFEISGSGLVQPFSSSIGTKITTLDLGLEKSLASSLQWSPTALAKYYFFSPSHKFRPYLGFGASYTWFTDVNLNPNFANQLNEKYGNALAILAGKPGLAYSSAKASSSWVPVYHAGASYMFTRRWGLVASLSYLPLHTKETVTTKAADGTPLLVNTEYLRLDPLVSALMLQYRF